MSAPVRVVAADREPPPGWDERVVRAPGGHLLQGRAWAAHRASRGWEPRFLRFSDEREALVLLRRRPPLPGVLLYAPRGPAPLGDPADRVAARAAALRDWARTIGALNLLVDPVLPADPGYAAAMAAAGFRPTAEVQPSRHRMVREIPAGATDEELLAGLSKSARQRVREAERAGVRIEEDTDGTHLPAFTRLVIAAAGRKGFPWSAEASLDAWWRRVLASGDGIFLVALAGDRLLGGLIAYRQGGTLATAFSADDAALRAERPGTMHALRFAAIRRARDLGATEIDLGGADVAPDHALPAPGTPARGLYDHKVSLGAHWEECVPAHLAVLRPGWLALGEAPARLRRVVRRSGRRT